MKKILALVLALAMLATCLAVYAAEFAEDTNVTIGGLDDGDVVSLYQILEWKQDKGWALTTKFASLDNATIAKFVANDPTAELTRADVEAITEFVKTNKIAADKSGNPTDGTYTETVALGMYLSLVKAAKEDTLYNPMIVSADMNATNDSNEIDASSALLGAIAKKETVTVEKEHSDITFNAGDYVQFTVTTTIPAFADSYNPTFVVTDTLSEGLTFAVDTTDHKFEVSSGDVTYTGGPTNGGTSYTLTFNSDLINALETPQAVTIKYWAQITDTCPHNVNEMNNTVEVTFSNNPGNDKDHGHLKDKTVEYTFDIDASVNGDESYITSEIVKVGVDPNGNIIFESKTLSNGSTHQSLADAVFGVYKTEADANGDTTKGDGTYDKYYTNEVFDSGIVTSDENGLLNIKGLKEGAYYIKELAAPKGYIKDDNVYSFTITAETETVTETETLTDGCEVTYSYEALKGYTVSFMGTDSTYTWTNQGPKVSSVVKNDESSEIANTKGLELPSTGGIGTTLFYAVGGLMVLTAGIVLVSRRKADEE